MNTPGKPDMTDPAQPAPQPDPMQFPMRFPIKVMGKNEDGFVHAITEIARVDLGYIEEGEIYYRLIKPAK